MRPTVLVIAGSDSSGGAGIVRDVQVLTTFQAEARCVVTAVTAQTNACVAGIHYLPPQLVRQQMRTALEADGIGAIKIGMLGVRATVEAVAETLPSRDHIPIVLDPVRASSSGVSLMETSALAALRELLLPLVTFVTPNLPEAAGLLSEEIATDEATMIEQAKRIQHIGPRAVLLKGGHATGEQAVDVLITGSDPPARMRASRLNATLRGTGCALSSAIAALLAQQVPLVTACERAKRYVLEQLQQAHRHQRCGVMPGE